MNYLKYKVMCVFAQRVFIYLLYFCSVYHGINVTKGFVKNILQEQCCMKEQYFFYGKQKRKV